MRYVLAILAVTALAVLGINQADPRWDEARAAKALHAAEFEAARVSAERDVHNAVYPLVAQALDAKAQAELDAAIALAEEAAKRADGKVETDILTEPVAETPAEKSQAAETLTAQAEELDAEVTAWEGEQARIAAEEEAARAQAEAPVAQPAPAPAIPSGVDHVEYVYGWGGQGLVDSCVGSVVYADYGGAGIVEHWSCGGSEFPQWAGAIVEIPGWGLYQTTGIVAVLDADVHNVTHLPGGFFYQTCLYGSSSNMIFIGLIQIG